MTRIYEYLYAVSVVKKLLFGVIILSLLGLGGYFLFFTKNSSTSENLTGFVSEKFRGASWSEPQKVTDQTPAGELPGQKITASVSDEIPNVMNFEDKNILAAKGFTLDQALSADGAGSSLWGYKREVNGKLQYLIFSYQATPSVNNPHEPLQFNCPCEIFLSVFLSEPKENSGSQTSLANPASENCTKVGGTLSIQKLGNGAEYGLCEFEDNMSCEEWALFRGECPAGGVKTTGYDNMGQMYCAWLGGKTLAVANSKCTLPDGTVCPTDSLFAGTCPSSS